MKKLALLFILILAGCGKQPEYKGKVVHFLAISPVKYYFDNTYYLPTMQEVLHEIDTLQMQWNTNKDIRKGWDCDDYALLKVVEIRGRHVGNTDAEGYGVFFARSDGLEHAFLAFKTADQKWVYADAQTGRTLTPPDVQILF